MAASDVDAKMSAQVTAYSSRGASEEPNLKRPKLPFRQLLAVHRDPSVSQRSAAYTPSPVLTPDRPLGICHIQEG